MGSVAGRILLVDDEPALLKMMSMYLTRRGFTVTVCDHTDGAWATAESAPGEFSAAVLDASMDGLPMTQLAARLLQSNPRLCVIATSGYPVDMAAVEASAPGRVAFLHKPFTPEMLADVLRRMIGPKE
jgi:DNA-binding NtrC family response regulator